MDERAERPEVPRWEGDLDPPAVSKAAEEREVPYLLGKVSDELDIVEKLAGQLEARLFRVLGSSAPHDVPSVDPSSGFKTELGERIGTIMFRLAAVRGTLRDVGERLEL